MRPIDADALIEKFSDLRAMYSCFDEEEKFYYAMYSSIINLINHEPTIDIDIPNETTYTPTEAHSYSISVCDSCEYIHVPFAHYPCSNCYNYDKYIKWSAE